MHLPDKPKVSYTFAQLEAVTGASAQTFRRAIRAGELKATRLGRRVLVTHDALMAYLKSHEDNGPARQAPGWMSDPVRRAAATEKRKKTMAALAEAEG